MMVSIIVPVYNAGKYLSQCIESVLHQSYQRWELLLLNDGSTDNSGKICDEYSSKDNRIKTIHKINTGASDTRNKGIDLARGKYIIFLDADDYWCSNNFLDLMVSISECNQLDIIRGEYRAVDEKGDNLFFAKQRNVENGRIYDSASYLNEVVKGEFFLVLLLIRRDAIKNCRFNVHQKFLEDMRFFSELMLNDMRCMYLPVFFYAYRKNMDSVSFKLDFKRLQDSFSMSYFFNELSSVATNIQLKKYYRRYSVMMYYWTLDTLSFDPYYNDRVALIRSLSLSDLRRKVVEWANLHCESLPIEGRVSPRLGVVLFRFRHRVGYYARKLRLYA